MCFCILAAALIVLAQLILATWTTDVSRIVRAVLYWLP